MKKPPADYAILLENPFRHSAARLQAAANRVCGQGPTRLSECLCAGDPETAQRIALAIGHAQAIATPDDPTRVLGPAVLDARGFRRLGRARADLLPIVMAAGRCHRALRALRGRSQALEALRATVWSLCFGDDLRHTAALRGVIHDHDVLLLGETGTGKEAVAHALAEGQLGGPDGKPAPAAAVNAAAISDTLMDSELFGHVRGAFTGAIESRGGLVRRAHRGTLFLDEVGDLPSTTQVKLLRVMETNRVAPLGSDREEPADVRYIAATHRDLRAMVEAGTFRRDFFQRIGDRVLELPPLRARPEDLQDIGLAFVDRYLGDAPELQPVRERAQQFLGSRGLRSHAFPGNVRELQNMLRSVMLGRTPTLHGDAPGLPSGADAGGAVLPRVLREHAATLRQAEDWYIERVLAHTGGNQSEASRILGIDRTTVARRARGLSKRARGRS